MRQPLPPSQLQTRQPRDAAARRRRGPAGDGNDIVSIRAVENHAELLAHERLAAHRATRRAGLQAVTGPSPLSNHVVRTVVLGCVDIEFWFVVAQAIYVVSLRRSV